jgi:hypothetical protein
MTATEQLRRLRRLLSPLAIFSHLAYSRIVEPYDGRLADFSRSEDVILVTLGSLIYLPGGGNFGCDGLTYT